MNAREQAAHVLRRFGLGASPEELERYEKLPPTKIVENLLDFDRTDEGFPISPYELVAQANGELQFDTSRITRWWALRLLLTKTPAREKLTLFWHDHFAVSGEKVEFGPMMLGYLEVLRKHGAGNFRDLLGAVSTCPAMLRWLDGDASIKGRPNENFARELMELFTLGIGNYTERDVQEVARAFTGWSLRNLYRGGDTNSRRAQLREALRDQRPLIASAYSAELNDDGVKTILGKTGRFDGDQVLDLLVSRPETARLVCSKLWEFYAYPGPEPAVLQRLVKVYFDSKYQIKPILMAIVQSKEFWSPKCVRALVKCPVDFTVAFMRQSGVGERLLARRAPDAGPMTPLPNEIRGVADALTAVMAKQGMLLLYPPDVDGWHWGTGWVSPAMMIERIRFAEIVTRNGALAEVLKPLAESGAEAVIDEFSRRFDLPLKAEQRTVLLEGLERAGGPTAFDRPQTAANVVRTLVRLTFAMPEYQFC
jgi:uncharacterized protein (DUF1800 family)